MLDNQLKTFQNFYSLISRNKIRQFGLTKTENDGNSKWLPMFRDAGAEWSNSWNLKVISYKKIEKKFRTFDC